MALSVVLLRSLGDLRVHIILFLASVGQYTYAMSIAETLIGGVKNTLHGQVVLPSEIL